jgi:hypothetical protein
MNYDTESWYKLYIRESTEDKLLPVLNRGLRDFLLRLAKSRTDGTVLAKTKDPGQDIARALGAHPGEVQTIVEFVATMLEDGFLSHRRGRLWITNFVRAQEAKSPGAKRQARWRGKRNAGATGDAPKKEDEETGDVTPPSRETLQEIRSDPRRSDPRRGDPAEPPAAAPVDDEQAADDRETPCPLDLPERCERVGIPAQFAKRYDVPIDAVRYHVGEIRDYWTIGAGAGTRRRIWPKTVRTRLQELAKAGKLGEWPGVRGAPSGPPVDTRAALDRANAIAAAKAKAAAAEPATGPAGPLAGHIAKLTGGAPA